MGAGHSDIRIRSISTAASITKVSRHLEVSPNAATFRSPANRAGRSGPRAWQPGSAGQSINPSSSSSMSLPQSGNSSGSASSSSSTFCSLGLGHPPNRRRHCQHHLHSAEADQTHRPRCVHPQTSNLGLRDNRSNHPHHRPPRYRRRANRRGQLLLDRPSNRIRDLQENRLTHQRRHRAGYCIEAIQAGPIHHRRQHRRTQRRMANQ